MRLFRAQGEVGDSANCLSADQLARIHDTCLCARDEHAAAVDGLGYSSAR